MLEVQTTNNEVRFGDSVTVAFERTLRVPEDGQTHVVPPGLDVFPLFPVQDFADRVPPSWRERGGVLVPMYAREALWISFSGRWWKPNAVLIGVDGVNAITGRPFTHDLTADPQDYVVVPDQPWLDAYYSADGAVRQYIAKPSMNGQPNAPPGPRDDSILIELAVFEPARGRFPDESPGPKFYPEDASCTPAVAGPLCEITTGPNGKMAQRLYPDAHGLDAWDAREPAQLCIRLVGAKTFREITGEEPPPSPIAADHYAEFRLPWLKAYAEGMPAKKKPPIR